MNKLLCKKSWNDEKNIFLDQWEKIIRYLPKKSFSVFRGVQLTSSSTLKLFFCKVFYKHFLSSWTNTFLLFQYFLHKILLILFNNVVCYCKALNKDGKKWLLIYGNPKTKILDLQKNSKGPKLTKNLPKETSLVIWLWNYWFFLLLQIFCN